MLLRKIDQDEFNVILRLHEFWLMGKKSGKMAILRYVDLRGVSLRGAELHDAILQGVNLSNVNLRYSNLSGAGLQDANLQGADLQDANLQTSNFQGADFRGAQFNQPIPHSCWIKGTKWLLADIPWWLGHPDQEEIVLCEE
jgi:uncharacterized protein YjbI with pentapeptide repeats